MKKWWWPLIMSVSLIIGGLSGIKLGGTFNQVVGAIIMTFGVYGVVMVVGSMLGFNFPGVKNEN